MKNHQTQQELLKKIMALRSWGRHELAAALKIPKTRLDSWLLPTTSKRHRWMKQEMIEMAWEHHDNAAMLFLMSLKVEFTGPTRYEDGGIWCEPVGEFFPELYVVYGNGSPRYTLDPNVPGARPINHLDATLDDYWVTITCFTEVKGVLRGFLPAARSMVADPGDLHLYEREGAGYSRFGAILHQLGGHVACWSTEPWPASSRRRARPMAFGRSL